MRRKGNESKSPELQQRAVLAPITLEQCLPVVRACSDDFAETCGLKAEHTSHSWWVRGIAQTLSNSGCSVLTDVRDHSFRSHLGNFFYAVQSEFPSGIDVLACPRWSRHELGEEEYGKDEPYLPAFHAVRIFRGRKVCSGKMEGWADFFEIGDSLRGPLTASIVGVDVFEGGEGYWETANRFRREMERLEISHEVSTKEMNSGILASVTVFEPADPFQILVASKVIERPAIDNPDYAGRRRRSPNIFRSL